MGTEGGRLPSTWKVERLDRIADIVSGGTPSKARPEWWNGSIPWVSPKDMKVPRLHNVVDYITQEAAEHGSRIVPAKSIFLVVRGMILANSVPVAIAERPMAFNQDMKAIIARAGVDPDFLFYAIRSRTSALTQEISTSAHGTRRMGSQAVEGLTVPMPQDPKEQSQIVRTLAGLEDAIAVQAKTVAALRELKATTMAKLLSEGLRNEPLRDTELGPLPRNWSTAPIGSLVSRAQYGLSIRGSRAGAYPILRMNCQRQGRVIMRDLQFVDVDDVTFQAYRVRKGDLLFNRTNSIDLVGRTAMCDEDAPAVFASYLVRLTPNERVVPAFLNHYLNLPSTQSALKGLATRAVGQSNISASKLKTFLAPISDDKAEEQEIVHIVDKLSDRIATAERKRDAISALFEVCLSRLMSGELRVARLLET